jgi:predicted RNA methylase
VKKFRRALGKTLAISATLRTWAHRQVYGVDKDSINIKLTRAMMMVLGDGSVNVHIGDSIREDRWKADYPYLEKALRDNAFTVVLTNPPFGENLKVSAKDCAANAYTLSLAAGRVVGELQSSCRRHTSSRRVTPTSRSG